MDINIVGAANFTQVRSQLAALEAQVQRLNAELTQTGIASAGVNPAGYRRMQQQMRASSVSFRDAAASSGQFLTQQVRLISATEEMTNRINKQKVGVKEMIRERKRLGEVYREQARLNSMYVREAPSMGAGGRGRYDIAVPRAVSSELNTINSRLAFSNALIKSASTQMVNWGKNTQWAGRQLMVGFTVPMAAFGAAAGVLAYQVDKEMTRIMKVYDTTAKAVGTNSQSMIRVEQELAQVREQSWQTARKASAEYGAAAKDTLALQAELAATGLTGDALQKSTTEAMRIATLGELEYQQAADTTVALQTAFKLSTQELTEAFNFMNATENATSLSIQDIAEATPRAASAMSALGVSVEEMTVLLVSMREAGVDAAEGANALKSATGTILAPSPAADKFIQQISQGQVQVTKLAEESGGNLYEALKILAEQMNGLSDVAKQQILVKLFGKYQFNRVSAMLYNLEDAVTGVGNQTATAMELMGKSAAENAQTAEMELGRFQNSLSGKFKIALENFKNTLQEMGAPFLVIATVALKTMNVLGKFFNAMPGWFKVVAAGGAIFLALSAPIIMLVGLIANFAGTMLNAARSVVFMGRRIGLATASTKAAEIASRSAAAGWDRQTTAVQGLTRQLEILTNAQIASQRAAMGLPMVMANGQPLGSAPVNVSGSRGNPSTAVPWSAPAGTGSNVNPQQAAYLSGIGSQMQTNFRVQEDTTRAAAQEAEQRKRTQRFLAGSALSAGVMAAAMGTMAISGNKQVDQWAMLALTAAFIVPMFVQAGNAIKGMVASMVAARAARQAEIVQQNALTAATVQTTAAQELYNASVLRGAASQRANAVAINMVTASATAAAAATGAVSAGTTAGAAGAAATTGRFAAMGAAVRGVGSRVAGLGRAIGGLMGPVGWVTTGLLALGFLIYQNHKKTQEQLKQTVETQRVLNNNAATWAQTMGKVVGSYDKINKISPTLGEASDFDQAVAGYKDSETDPGKNADAFDALSSIEQERRALTMFIDLQKEGGFTAKEAAQNIAALYYSTGSSLSDANNKGEELYQTIGDISRVNWSETLTTAAGDFSSSYDEMMNAISKDTGKGGDAVWEAGQRYGKIFSQAFAEADTQSEAKAVYSQLEELALKPWQDLFSKMSQEQVEWMKKNNITTAEGLRDYALANEKTLKVYSNDNMASADKGRYEEMIAYADEYTSSLLNSVGVASGLGDQIWGLAGFTEDLAIKSKMISFADKEKEVNGLVDSLLRSNEVGQTATGTFGVINRVLGDMNDAQARAAIEQYAFSEGVELSDERIQAILTGMVTFEGALRAAKIEAREVANEARNIKNAMGGIKNPFSLITWDDGKEILKTATNEMQEQMASQAETNLDNRNQAALDSLQAQWDARLEAQQNAAQRASEALDARQEAQTEKFENRWEKRKDRVTEYWENRIDKINKGIEAEERAEDIRQKIFDAEMTRLDRLNESANRNIDFNVALNSGNFDEAAKIRNDAEAQFAQYALEDAQGASQQGSERRRERMSNAADRLGDRKDKALEALDKLEEAERKSMEKRQDAEREHLDRMQDIRAKSLKKQADAAIKQRKEDQELDKISYMQRLELFKAFNGRSIDEILKWADTVGIKYEDFGDNRLKPMGKDWATFFKDQLVDKIGKAGAAVASNKVWENMAKDEVKAILGAYGFPDLKSLRKFSRTGVMPKRTKPQAPNGGGRDMSMGGGNPTRVAHIGGEVGKGKNSRKGVARTQRGLHPSEQMVLAKKKEFIVNEKSYAANKSLIQNINSSNGPVDPSVMPRGVMGGAGIPGGLGVASGVMANVFMQGLNKNLAATLARGKQRQEANRAAAATQSLFSAGSAGTYGSLSLASDQLINARTIANVGKSMGMSARDIQIGIMTAITESMLKNVDYGDRDSLGLFQQRPSQGWGTPEQVTDPEYASRKFFTALKGISNRDDRLPWYLAQDVQRSAYDGDPYPYGSNYQQYWDEAQAIFQRGLTRITPGGVLGSYGPGPGGKHRPVRSGYPGGLHDTSTGFPGVDFALPSGSGVYAVGNGVITRSYDIKGYEPRRVVRGQSGAAVQDGYRSYGRVMEQKLDGGPTVLYAHLSQRGPLGRVAGGTQIGKVGNTGYVISGSGDGSHLHFGSSDGNPLQFLAKGGTTSGQGLAYLHDQETVLSKPLSRELQDAVKAFGAAGRSLMKGRATPSAQPFNPGRGGKAKKSNKYSVDTYGMNTNTDIGAQRAILAASYLNNNVGSMYDPSWFQTPKKAKKAAGQGASSSTEDSGSKGSLKIGTLNTWVKASAKSTIMDLKKMIEGTDFLALTEMGSKYRQVGKWLKTQNWGYVGGGSRAQGHSIMAYNKATQQLEKKGQRKLGDKMADVIGGREKRYANYGLFTDKESGRKTWQVAAHTVPAGRGLNAKNGPLFREQWANLDKLVTELRKTAPAFVSGDLNLHQSQDAWRTPGGLDVMGARGVDYIFGDKKYAKLINSRNVNGLHTDHGGGLMSNIQLPAFKNGGFTLSDGMAMLHKKEMVADAPMTADIREGVKNFANGGTATYNLTVNANGSNLDAQQVARMTIKQLQAMEDRLPRSRKG